MTIQIPNGKGQFYGVSLRDEILMSAKVDAGTMWVCDGDHTVMRPFVKLL